MSQSIFSFEERHDYMPENFMVSASNRAAYEAAINFPEKFYALNIYGERSCGKTFLAHISSTQNAEKKINVLEDLEADVNQQELLRIINSIKENNEYLLITSLTPLAEMGWTLPDLKSRLKAIPAVGIEQPDEELIYMMLARQFAARQKKVADDVLNFLASRTERNFENINNLVEKIDTISFQQKRDITLPFIKTILPNAA